VADPSESRHERDPAPTGSDVVVLRQPVFARYLYLGGGLFCVLAFLYAVYREVTDTATSYENAEGMAPPWVQWPVLAVLFLVGLFALNIALGTRVRVSSREIGRRGLIGRWRTVERDSFSHVRISTDGSALTTGWKTMHIRLQQGTGRARRGIYVSSDMVPLTSVLETLREWAVERPDTIADDETRAALGMDQCDTDSSARTSD
jgi:hypothetical protein